MIAVEHEWHDIIELLLSYKVNLLKKESSYGNTALHISCLKGDKIACKLLFSSCQEAASEMNYQGETPLHLAVRSKSLECLRIMKKFKV